MTLDQLQLIRDVLADWAHQSYEDAVQIIEKEIQNKKRGLKPLRSIPAHQRHSDTSIDAALEVTPTKFTGRRLSVLKAILQQPMTDEEAQVITGIEGNSYRPCRVSLMESGMVEDSGIRRKTRSQKYAVVWQITSLGKTHLKDQHESI